MTTEETKPDCGCDDDAPPDDGCDETPPAGECVDCDTTLINTLKCKAAGVAAEAAYNAEYQKDVSDAQAEFNAIANAYRAARTGVRLQVNDMRHETKRAIARIRCMIKQRRIVECLDESWCEVERELACCKKDCGCCVPAECEFPIPCKPEKPDCQEHWAEELKALVTTYTERTQKSKDCFTALKGEAAALEQRVRDRKADLDALLAKLTANDPSTDLRRLYADAVVLRYRLKHIWNGFWEPKDFVDCLCRALTCWTEGSAHIAVLKRMLAVYDCEEQAKADRCTYVKEHTAEVILTVYEKKCCPDPCPPPTDECDDDDDKDECEDDDDDHHDCDCRCHDKGSGATAR